MTKILRVDANGYPAELDLVGMSSIVSNYTNSTTTETVVVQSPVIEANSLVAGAAFRARILGVYSQTSTTANTSKFRLRIGPNGTIADAQVALLGSASNAAASTSIAFEIEAIATIRSIGVSGSAIALISLRNNGTTGVSSAALRLGPSGVAPATVAVNTTVANRISFTAQPAVVTATITVAQAIIERIM